MNTLKAILGFLASAMAFVAMLVENKAKRAKEKGRKWRNNYEIEKARRIERVNSHSGNVGMRDAGTQKNDDSKAKSKAARLRPKRER